MSSEPGKKPDSGAFANLRTWVASWPQVRQELEQCLAEHARRDPMLHFEPRLAEIELKDVDEAIHRLEALSHVLAGDSLASAEGEGTGSG